MSLCRRRLLLASGALALAGVPTGALSQGVPSTDSLRLGVTLEPPGLDPTSSAASSIAEVTLYNVYETLTKIDMNRGVLPLLAQSWHISEDLLAYTFQLERGVTFHNGAAFNAQTVAFSLMRAGAADSTNKDRSTFANIAQTVVLDDYTIRLELHKKDPDLLFRLGMATAIMVESGSVATNRTQPVGTGPYYLQSWRKGASLTLEKWDNHRNADLVSIKRATFTFISDATAQAVALLAGDIDVFARASLARSLSVFKKQPERFQVLVSDSLAKTLLAMNNRKPPLNDLRVRQAITAAIDRQAVVEAAADGFGVPIGSHYVPGMPGYVDTTGINPYNPDRARDLLAQAGVAKPLILRFILPPTPYARQGGEIIAAMLSQVGIKAQIENVEWAQWLSAVYTNHSFDLTIVSHVEPLDLDNATRAQYYWGYQSEAFNQLYERIQQTPLGNERNQLLVQAQELLAQDAVNVWLYQPKWITVANAHLRGLWTNMPIFVNDLAGMSWV